MFRAESRAGSSVGPVERRSSVDFEHIGILNDYVRIPYATGSVFAAQFLHAEFTRRGHAVTLVGPRDPKARPDELPDRHVLLPSLPVRSQPGFFLPMPTRGGLRELADQHFDVLVGQTGSELMDAGVWLRNTRNIPLLCVNTTLLASLYDALLPEALHGDVRVQRFCEQHVVPFAEQACVKVFNQSDGLIVLSKGLEAYWRELGVVVPIHVIPRAVDPRVQNAVATDDPYPSHASAGGRILVLCRLVREKGVARLIDIFAEHVAPHVPDATLTLVGDGADRDAFAARAERHGVGHRTFFAGERAVTEVKSWYHHADLFVYASMSETYGQVVSEAMWCGLPVVAFDDRAGVAQQIQHGRDGLLLPPGPDRRTANARFGAEVAALLAEPARRRRLGEAAERSARLRTDPDRCIQRYYTAFEQARRHRALCRPDQTLVRQARGFLRWTAIHAFVGAAGMLRPPALLNRNGAKQPGWGAAASPPPPATSGLAGEAAA